MTSARELTTALRGRWRGDYGVVSCPVPDHGRGRGDRNPSLAIRERDGRLFVYCNGGCGQDAVIDALRARGLWSVEPTGGIEALRCSPKRKAPADATDNRTAAALEIWKSAAPITGTLGETYLRNRGIRAPLPPSLRFASSLRYTPAGVEFPAMVAAVQSPSRQIAAIHRTYLTLDGAKKAPVSAPKMALGSLGGGAVRLAKAGPVLGIAEGVEDALSAMALFGVPCWAALGAARLHRIALPDDVREIRIFADNGDAGRTAARKAAGAYARTGHRVVIHYPPADVSDFNDALQSKTGAA